MRAADRNAAFAFIQRATLPILQFPDREPGDTAASLGVGTGTLFFDADRLFLVSARHVLLSAEPRNLAIPESPQGGFMWSLSSMNLHWLDEEIFDTAIVEITDDATKAKLRAGWRALPLSLAAKECPPDGAFVLYGYPWEKLQRRFGKTVGHGVRLLTARIDTPSAALEQSYKQPVHEEVDLFFEYPESFIDFDDKAIGTPKLSGISGCAVWSITPPGPNESLNPLRDLRVVGIQSSVLENFYIRAKSWRWANDLLTRV